MFLSTKVNGKIHHYRVYLSTTIPLFLPTNYTKEEMRKFYDKFAPIIEVERKAWSCLQCLFFCIKQPFLWKKIAAILKPKGLLMMIGNDFEPPLKLFKKVKSGKYEIIPGYKAQWYVGRKK